LNLSVLPLEIFLLEIGGFVRMETSSFDILTGSSDSPDYPTSADYQFSFGGGSGSGGNPFGGGSGSGGNPFGGGSGSGGNPFGGGGMSSGGGDMDELFQRSPWGRLESVGITNFGQVFGGVMSSGGGNPFG
jgi:hypothetical protein